VSVPEFFRKTHFPLEGTLAEENTGYHSKQKFRTRFLILVRNKNITSNFAGKAGKTYLEKEYYLLKKT